MPITLKMPKAPIYTRVSSVLAELIWLIWVNDAIYRKAIHCHVVSILIADDSSEWRERAREILRERPGWEIIAEACDGQDAVQFAADLRPDVVLLDIGMPVLNGLEAAKIIRHACPEARIIFVTLHNDEDITGSATEIGAVGYVLKTEAASELLRVIEAALQQQP